MQSDQQFVENLCSPPKERFEALRVDRKAHCLRQVVYISQWQMSISTGEGKEIETQRKFLLHFLTLQTQIKVSASFLSQPNMSSSKTIEHVVLLKLKHNTDPSDSTSMITKLNSLSSLDQVLHLTAGPLLRVRSTSLNFTHILHSRYTSKSDLIAYAVHPRHQSVAEGIANLVDDVMAVDWISNDLAGPVSLPAGSAMIVSLLKLKEDVGEEAKSEILERIRGIKEESEGLTQFSVGENFAPEMAKGFSMAFLEVFSSQKEMEAVDLKREDKFKDYLDSFLELSYVVAS